MARRAAWRMAAAPAMVAFGAGLALAGPSWGADPTPSPAPAASPLADTVRHEVARHVPPSWRVEAVTLEPGESATGPLRVAARLALAKPTYVVEGRDGPYAFVRPVAEAGTEKVLTGIATTSKARDGSVAAVRNCAIRAVNSPRYPSSDSRRPLQAR